MKRGLFTTLLLVSLFAPLLFADEALPKANLPKVLIIGDSISIGYTPFVIQALKDQAVVFHNKGNAQHTGTGLERLDQWIGDTKWEVIHFNWGLWDLCYRQPDAKNQGNRNKDNGSITTSLEQYGKNLDELVTRLKKTYAKLIWAHTSVVPEKEAGRRVGDDQKYNEVATTIMKKHGVAIDDLYTLTKGFPAELFAGVGNVHYTKAGYAKIAEQVADKIKASLKQSAE